MTPKPAGEWTLRSTSGSIAPVVKVVLLDEARRRFEAEDEWWREHRDAEELFVEEFAQALDQLSFMPAKGQRYRLTCGKLIQRVLMKKTGCHAYSFHDRERDLVEVHSIWGACRERGRTWDGTSTGLVCTGRGRVRSRLQGCWPEVATAREPSTRRRDGWSLLKVVPQLVEVEIVQEGDGLQRVCEVTAAAAMVS